MRTAWIVLAAACGFSGCSADPEAGSGTRTPVQSVPAGTGGMGTSGVSGALGGTGGRPPPPALAGSGGSAAADAGPGGGPASDGAMPQPGMDAGPPPRPFCDDDDAGVEQGSCIAIGDFRVQHKSGDMAPADNAVRPHFNVINDGTEPVDLTELTIRYWFTNEGSQPQMFWCDYAQLGCERIRGTFVAAMGEGADYYLELSFASGSLAPSAQTGEIQVRFNKQDWSVYDELNDYSFDARTAFQDSPNVTLYRRGTLAWGAEPPLP